METRPPVAFPSVPAVCVCRVWLTFHLVTLPDVSIKRQFFRILFRKRRMGGSLEMGAWRVQDKGEKEEKEVEVS